MSYPFFNVLCFWCFLLNPHLGTSECFSPLFLPRSWFRFPAALQEVDSLAREVTNIMRLGEYAHQQVSGGVVGFRQASLDHPRQLRGDVAIGRYS